ncbi:hypothetical protein [Bdellovibrio sp. HCB274]|uniref:hypothetical protein n=1 Tax=Bdellovibrio sp. HCB274 TaxID=3394361 RepID=UPI0039B40DB9
MKKIVMFAIALSAAVTSHAAPLAPTKAQISPDDIDQAIRLSATRRDSALRKITVVVTDSGSSTDVSPRHTIYFTYNSFAEMGNMRATYLVAEDAFADVQATRVSAGIYEVSYIAYRAEQGMVKVTKTIDATEAFIEDKAKRDACGYDFCDAAIEAAIDMKETSKKAQNW